MKMHQVVFWHKHVSTEVCKRVVLNIVLSLDLYPNHHPTYHNPNSHSPQQLFNRCENSATLVFTLLAIHENKHLTHFNMLQLNLKIWLQLRASLSLVHITFHSGLCWLSNSQQQ